MSIALSARAFVLFYADITYDDAHITMRVARNMADGLGAVYNPGERIQASTSLLYTFVCGLLWKLVGSHTLPVVKVFAAVVDAVNAALLSWHVEAAVAAAQRPFGRASALFAGGLYAAISTSVLIATAGLETAYYCAAALLALIWAGSGHFSRAGAAAGAAVLLRPDGALVLGVVGLVALRARKLQQLLLPALLILVPCLLAQQLYFGSVVPQTVAAKGLIERAAGAQWRLLVDKFFWGNPVRLCLGALILVGSWRSRTLPRLSPLVVWGWGYAFVFSTFGMWWPWYWPPLVLAYAVAFGLGAGWALELAAGRIPRLTAQGWERLGFAASLVLMALFSTKTWSAVRAVRPLQGPVTQQRRDLARWIASHSGPEATVLIEPMGQLGFFLDRRIDDYPGLASPRVTRALRGLKRPIGGNPMDSEALATVLQSVRPSYVILRENELRAAERAGALAGYEVVYAARLDPTVTAQSPDLQTMYVAAVTPPQAQLP